ncbi:MAG: AAA family ATPase, partial [Clostridia bacterium]|nr:AAA family ATPase [Clostridia bacterium]
MSNYNPKSLKAEEFISDAEILETLKYAEENKNNIELIDSLLEKARPKKTEQGVTCAGLTHREASVLLPRTQAGLLECMEEKQVTIDGVSYQLPEPFFVIATQN